jgi:hypothetical protein
MPGSELDRVAGALAADVRGADWLARSGATEFALLRSAASPDAETAADRLLHVVAGAGVPGLTACAGIAGLSSDASPSEVRRAPQRDPALESAVVQAARHRRHRMPRRAPRRRRSSRRRRPHPSGANSADDYVPHRHVGHPGLRLRRL